MVCMSSGELFLSGEPLSLSHQSLTFSDKIKAYTGDMPFFILCIIPHIDSIFRNLTGFCDFFRSTWFSVQIKRNTFFPVNLKFFTECLCRILFYPWYIFRIPTSFPGLIFRKHQQWFMKSCTDPVIIYKKLKGGNFLFCVMAESPMSFTQKFIFRKSMTLSYLCSLTAFTDLVAFLFLLYLFSFQMQAFCSIIKFFLFLSRNFLFSHWYASLHLVYSCYIIQYVKD